MTWKLPIPGIDIVLSFEAASAIISLALLLIFSTSSEDNPDFFAIIRVKGKFNIYFFFVARWRAGL